MMFYWENAHRIDSETVLHGTQSTWDQNRFVTPSHHQLQGQGMRAPGSPKLQHCPSEGEPPGGPTGGGLPLLRPGQYALLGQHPASSPLPRLPHANPQMTLLPWG